MKRIATIVAVVVLVLTGASMMLAQGTTDSYVGTWKLNVAKSRYKGTPAPKESTLTIEAQGDGQKVTVRGTSGDGSHVEYGYTSKMDGKRVPVTGTGVPNGADEYAVKRISSHERTTTSTKKGKVVRTSRSVLSKDGKVLTLTTKGVDEHGAPTSTVGVYDRQ